MPIHLSSLSRRQFLKRSLLAGATLAFAPNLLAARRTDANSWALLADTHIFSDRSRMARSINMTQHFVQVSNELLRLPKRPAGVFVLGDCAFNSGEKADYATFTELLDPLRTGQLPLHLALGNHDHRENFWAALEEKNAAVRPMQEKHVALIRTPRVNWFMLDSLEVTLQTPGLLGTDQLQWLAKTLDANPKKPAVILVHHNPGNSSKPGGLKDESGLFDVIRARRHVKACMFGHTHKWTHWQDDSGIHLVNLPPVAYVFAETDPSGWVQATTQRNGIKLELRCINTAHQQHGEIVELKWRKG